MIRVRQAVVVEGKYDKIRLSSFLDALILTTDGFAVFHDKEKLSLLRALAVSRGLILLTDSDPAGLQIRHYLRQAVREGEIVHVFVPEIHGREKRKDRDSAAGLLGVEGMSEEILTAAFAAAGVTAEKGDPDPDPVTKMDLYRDGFYGAPDAAAKRRSLCRVLGLPTGLNANLLPVVIADLYGRAGYEDAKRKVLLDNPTGLLV